MLTTIPEITRHAPMRVPSSNIYHPSRNIFKESNRDKLNNSGWITVKKNSFKQSFDKSSFGERVNIRDKNYFIYDKSNKSNLFTGKPKKDIIVRNSNMNTITTSKARWSIIDCYHNYTNQYLVRVPSYQWVNSRKIYRSHNSPNLPNLLGKWVYVESDTPIPMGDSISIGMKTHTNKKGVEIITYFYNLKE